MEQWTDLFGGAPPISPAQECARAVLVFFYGLVLFRLAGRRAFARWSALDIVVAIVSGSNLSRALTGQAALGGTLAATTVLVVLHCLVARAAARCARVSRLVEGLPVEVVKGGARTTAALRYGVTEIDADEAARAAGHGDARSVATMMLEPSGMLTTPRQAPIADR